MRAWIGALALALSAGAAAQSLPKFNERLMRQAMDAHLKDAESARFRSVRQQASSEHPGAWIICGEVNAKNAYGGYAGFSHFQAVGGIDQRKKLSYLVIGVGDLAQQMCAKEDL